MSLHKEHRRRMKERYLEEGLDAFNEHQVLELLLFYCIPRRDTNEIAHNLIKRFGSFSQVFRAPIKELKKVEGIGEQAAIYISLLKDFLRYYSIQQTKDITILRSITDCGNFLVPFFETLNMEAVYLLCLDGKCKVISCREVARGNVNATEISIRKIVDIALTENASSVVLAHNHPDGLALPSYEDEITTQKIAQALRMVDVVLNDHIIVADGDYISFVHSSKYNPHKEYLEF